MVNPLSEVLWPWFPLVFVLVPCLLVWFRYSTAFAVNNTCLTVCFKLPGCVTFTLAYLEVVISGFNVIVVSLKGTYCDLAQSKLPR